MMMSVFNNILKENKNKNKWLEKLLKHFIQETILNNKLQLMISFLK